MTVAYLHHAATTDPGRRYKSRLMSALDLHPGLTVLDVGCGPATDLPAMAAEVASGAAPDLPAMAAAVTSGLACGLPAMAGSGPAGLAPRSPALGSASDLPAMSRPVRPGTATHLPAVSPAEGALPNTGRLVGFDAGRVIGVDRDPMMLDEARRRCETDASIELLAGDAHHLPLDDASVDRARADRVFQHLADPAKAAAELRRVVRPGGRVVVADPDWDTLAIADPDTATSRAFTRYVTTHVIRNATVGRELARLLHTAGFDRVEVTAEAILFTDYAEADAILRMPEQARRGRESGALDPHATRAWLSRLATAPFVATFTLFTVTAA
ncbi:methyltransferase domain-containing protein [Actinoplanes sp. NPDC051470]|uniref:methyltransferase domain-containing protein n=1 Tax=Actinoplanes sp. NPDC051470 TaxID=3157224 RepID=UPI00341AF2D8